MRIVLEWIGIGIMMFVIYDMASVRYSKPIKAIWRLTKSYPVQIVGYAALFAAAVGLILQGLVPAAMCFAAAGILGKTGLLLRIFLFLAAVLLFLFFFRTACNPAWLMRLFRNINHTEANVCKAPSSETVVWEESYYLTNDVLFSSKFPGNYMDIYSREKDFSVKRPVFLYAHGGGFVAGDKSNGDPNALGIAGIVRMIKQLLDAGFTVISTGYVLAPEYQYPAPIMQMTELLQFLMEHQEKFGLDMERVCVGGGSAGGHIMAQLAAIQTNPAYAKEMGIEPVLCHGELKAVYHGCALLDNERFGNTGSGATDYLFYQMGRAYFHTGVLEGNPSVIQSDVIRHVTKDYPASFICDGNSGTFNAQAHDLARRLTELGVKNKALIFDEPGYRRIPHGFDTLEYEEGEHSMQEMVAFVKEEVGLDD